MDCLGSLLGCLGVESGHNGAIRLDEDRAGYDEKHGSLTKPMVCGHSGTSENLNGVVRTKDTTPNWTTLPKGFSYGDKVYLAMYESTDVWGLPTLHQIKKNGNAKATKCLLGRNGEWAVGWGKPIQFSIEKAPHGAFALREVTASGGIGHALVRAGDWLSLQAVEDGETESIGWTYYSEGAKDTTSWDTTSEPIDLYFWSRGPDWPMRMNPDWDLTFKPTNGNYTNPYNMIRWCVMVTDPKDL